MVAVPPFGFRDEVGRLNGRGDAGARMLGVGLISLPMGVGTSGDNDAGFGASDGASLLPLGVDGRIDGTMEKPGSDRTQNSSD